MSFSYNRFLAKFPTSATLASGKERMKPPMEASLAAANDDKSRNLEEAHVTAFVSRASFSPILKPFQLPSTEHF
jgi:hypothetical protein